MAGTGGGDYFFSTGLTFLLSTHVYRLRMIFGGWFLTAMLKVPHLDERYTVILRSDHQQLQYPDR